LVNHDNVVIDGQGNTLIHCDTGEGRGIRILKPVTAIEIKNLNIVQGNYDPGKGDSCSSIYRPGSSSGLNIHDNTITINNSGSVAKATLQVAIYQTGISSPSINNSIKNNVINLNGTSAAYGISFSADGAGSTWEGEITGNEINMNSLTIAPAGRPNGIRIGSLDTTGATISDNTINADQDGFNILGIALAVSDGWTIDNNTINMTAGHSRAMLLEGSDNNTISNNNITMDSAVDFSGEAGRGMVIRWGSDNNLVTGNTIIATGIDQIGFTTGNAEIGTKPEFATTPKNNVISNNIFRSGFRAVNIARSTDYTFSNNTIEGVGAGFPVYIDNNISTTPSPFLPTDVVFNNDTFTSEGQPLIRLLGDMTNVIFCNTALLQTDILATLGPQTYSLNCDGSSPIVIP